MPNNPTPNASYSLTLRVKIQNSPGKLGEITTAIGRVGGDIEGIDIVSVGKDFLIRDITVNEIITENELYADYIIPSVFDRRVGEAVAQRVEEAAYATSVARRERTDSDSEF